MDSLRSMNAGMLSGSEETKRIATQVAEREELQSHEDYVRGTRERSARGMWRRSIDRSLGKYALCIETGVCYPLPRQAGELAPSHFGEVRRG
jgi:hypothetical protein